MDQKHISFADSYFCAQNGFLNLLVLFLVLILLDFYVSDKLPSIQEEMLH